MKQIFSTITVVALLALTVQLNAKAKNDPGLRASMKTSKSAKKSYSMVELTKNIEYDFGRINIRNNYYDKLDQLAKTMIDGNYAVALRGYADSIGTFKANWVISDKRAKQVKTYLIGKGVDGSKIITTPFGSTKPIASNKTKQGRQRNRRVEIKVNELNQ